MSVKIRNILRNVARETETQETMFSCGFVRQSCRPMGRISRWEGKFEIFFFEMMNDRFW